MELKQNTLYVVSQGAYVHRDHLTIKVDIERETKLAVPIHHVESVALFGNVMVSPGLMELCGEAGVPITFLSEHGRLIARVDAPCSGNVLLRREQFRWADRADQALELGRSFVAGKLQNARGLMLRAARESDQEADTARLEKSAGDLAYSIEASGKAGTLDEIRGHEGESARSYFSAFSCMVRKNRETFGMNERTRRPPLDPINALLSFSYALLLHDCVAALTAAGLDPSVGFLHVDRPGRPSLALDLMEEFRPLIADRLVLALINRGQVAGGGFVKREGGSIEMDDATRRAILKAYQERKQDEVTHPLLDQKARVGQLPFLQAKLLARTIRGDLPSYPPCVPR